MTPLDRIASAEAALLASVAAERAARCAAILRPAEAAAQARLASATARIRSDLRAAMRAELGRLRRECAQARAACERQARERAQRLAALAAAEGLALLRENLLRRWRDSAQRSAWVRAAVRRAAARLPHTAWRILHAPPLAPDELQALRQICADAGVGECQVEAANAMAAGLEIHAGPACLDASVDGLLVDRDEWAGRLLHLWSAACVPR